jgi:hypothetical protein
MRTITIAVVLVSGLVIAVAEPIHAHASVVVTSTRDSSTGPFNPNLPSPDALPRRGA